MRKRVAILISGRGSNMAALIAAAQHDYPAEIALVLSNRPDAAGLDTARKSGVATAVLDHCGGDSSLARARKPADVGDVRQHQHDLGRVGGIFRGLDQRRHV